MEDESMSSLISILQHSNLSINTQATLTQSPVDSVHGNPVQNTHPYQPLVTPRTTRIVLLAPGPKDSPIHCHLLQVDLDGANAPLYEALSYEWGQPSDDDPTIYLDDHAVRIRANLFHALQHIRTETGPRGGQAIWIDSLSIDQSNLSERSHQVQIMRDIYKQASAVTIWLGPARDNSDTAMQLLADPVPHSLELSSDQRAAVEALCKRSYWRRVWIQQEVHLARTYTIRCGAKSMSEATFDQGLYACFRKRVDTHPASEIIIRRRPEMALINTLRIWILISHWWDWKTSEPHDYVYGMLSISIDCQHGEIVPDYEKPLVALYFEVLAIYRPQKRVPGLAKALAEKLGLLGNKRVRAAVKREELRWRTMRMRR